MRRINAIEDEDETRYGKTDDEFTGGDRNLKYGERIIVFIAFNISANEWAPFKAELIGAPAPNWMCLFRVAI